MATMTSEVMVLRPPSPQLGNFNKIFSKYLESYSQTEAKIDVHELLPITLPDLDKLWGLEKPKKNKTKKIEDPNPQRARLEKAAKGVISGQIKEFVPSPPQAANDGFHLPPVTPGDILTGSPTREFRSDTTRNLGSIFDSGFRQIASATTTPLSTPGTVVGYDGASYNKASPSIDCGDVFVSTPRKTRGMGHNTPALLAIHNEVAYSQNVVAANGFQYQTNGQVQMVSTYNPATGLLSSDGTFRYKVSGIQPFKSEGAKVYAVGFAKPGTNDRIKPGYMSTKEDKKKVLYSRLDKVLVMDRGMKANMPTTSNKVHVFVDLSNITIGFYDALKIRHKIPVTKRMKAPPFCFEHLAHVLERGREVEKRVVAGSLLTTYARKWPDYMQEANDLGYEMNILQRVPKAASPVKKQRTIRRPNGEVEWTTSDGDSAVEDVVAGQLKQGEQGVDEVLHLKMLQSALDSAPGTAVLATGDAAEAEYSDGFKKNVERLLQQGWNVEIIGWSKGISQAWKDPEFTKKWGDRVRVIELDLYVEEFFGAWFGAPGY